MDVHEAFANFFDDVELRPFAYLVSKKLMDGHICVNLDDIDIDEELKSTAFKDTIISMNHLEESNYVTSDINERAPFFYQGGNLYLHRYFSYETHIIEKIDELVRKGKESHQERIDFLEKEREFVSGLTVQIPVKSNETEDEKVDWQFAATITGFLRNFSIITGGPGTGKTTTVAKLLALLFQENPDYKIALTAPTGKAAIRMEESLKERMADFGIEDQVAKIKASTIHRLLGYIPNSPYFRHNEGNYLDADIVIVDEASMIDLALFSKLISAINPTKRIILLGDKDQLASVEAGSLLGDLCFSQRTLNLLNRETANMINSLMIDDKRHVSEKYIHPNNENGLLFEHIIELKKSHRFTSDSGIGKLSKGIITSDPDILKQYYDTQTDPDIVIDLKQNESIFNEFIKGFEAYIQEDDIFTALELLNEQKVLCAVKNGERGVHSANDKIEHHLKRKNLIRIDDIFYENRPIIVTKNYKDLELYNGDIGIIRSDANGNKKAWFIDNQNELRAVSPGYIAECETVFAMTIHKSQGSEYNKVLVILPNNSDNKLLTKELLYTGVTRAKEKVIIQGSDEVITASIMRTVSRSSGITKRIQEL